MMVEFAKNLADFAADSGKKHVIVLSSLDFGQWQRIDMSRYSKQWSYCSETLYMSNIVIDSYLTLHVTSHLAQRFTHL